MLANEIWTYWRRVHRRAFDDTKHILRIETGVRAMIAAAVTVCVIAMIWFIGESDIAHHEIVVRLSFIAVILIVLPFAYGWQFLTTPAKLDMDAQEAIASLTASCSAERRRKIKVKLQEFYAAVDPMNVPCRVIFRRVTSANMWKKRKHGSRIAQIGLSKIWGPQLGRDSWT